ncbi:hypothetical protein MBLNU457_g2471t3 [Dothideomycetes sp. NU457]
MDEGVDLKEYVKRLLRQVEAKTLDKGTQQKLRSHLASSLPLPLAQLRSINANDIGKLGTELFNAATRANREAPDQCPGSMFALLRACGFSLVDAAYRASVKRGGQDKDAQVRAINVSLKAARTCIDNAELDVCGQIFLAAADHVAALTGNDSGKNTDNKDAVDQVVGRMISDFWILRATHSWKTNRIPMAEYFLNFVKLNTDNDEGVAGLVRLADLQYEIGKDFLRKGEWQGAVTWLERSCNGLDSVDPSRLSEDTMELRMSAMHDLIKALLGSKDEKATTRAADLIALLESEFGNKMAISMLKLELLSMREPVPADEYQRVIVAMMTSVVLSDPNFKTIMHHIQKLKGWNASSAARTLDSFLINRLYAENNMVYIEKTLVTRVWISTSQAVSLEEVQSLAATVNDIYNAARRSLNADATHAAQTLMWKSIDKASATEHFEIAKAWCRLTQHPLFDNAGEINKSKLARKMISLSLSQNDPAAAREAFFQMPESGKDAISTRYLMYRVGLYSQDEELTMSSLDKIVQTTDKDATYLYACVLEAQKAGDRKHTVVVLQKVLQKFNYATPPGIYLPALLRSTALMMMKELESDESAIDGALTELCRIFEAAVLQEKHFQVTSDESSGSETYQLELSWFAKNSYNLASKYCERASPTSIVRLLQSSLGLNKLLRGRDGSSASTNLDKRDGRCHYLIAFASIVLARSEDNIQTSKQHYTSVRKHVEAYLAIATADDPDARAKASQLLQLDLEASLKLEQWNDLVGVLDKWLQHSDNEHLEALADLVLVIHDQLLKADVDRSHHEKFPAVMSKIINASWRSTNGDMLKLARWLRCVFRMTFATNPEKSLEVLDQVVAVCNGRSDNYPKDELHWLAATAFNQCVDLSLASDTKGAQIWGDKALNLARMSGPALFQQMQGLRMKVNGLGDV